MKITRFEEFLERSVPYFIIGLLLVILLVMGSCDEENTESKRGQDYNILIIDGCEYIEYRYLIGLPNGLLTITHKGNCKNHKPCGKEN